ncbi:MAG: DNA repair protein RadC [Arenicellales bacterium]
MAIKDWPDEERPREKLLNLGPQALSDAELLAIFLRTGTRGSTAVDVARQLLGDFGGLRQVASASRSELCSQAGVGISKYVALKAALEIGQRCLAQRLERGEALTSPDLTRTFLRSKLQDRPFEVFCCLYLDTKHRVIRFEEMFRGTIDGASVHPREVVRAALGHNAAAVIVAHNHPSGVAEPSAADNALTRRLQEALAMVDIRLLDHLVVGDGETVSFAERGLL